MHEQCTRIFIIHIAYITRCQETKLSPLFHIHILQSILGSVRNTSIKHLSGNIAVAFSFIFTYTYTVLIHSCQILHYTTHSLIPTTLLLKIKTYQGWLLPSFKLDAKKFTGMNLLICVMPFLFFCNMFLTQCKRVSQVRPKEW